jgi:phenylglyoxylate dehydrogenase epsilon subunit
MRTPEQTEVVGVEHTHYLIAGASHAALAAMHTIRMADSEATLAVVGPDDVLPYSPTVLPYVVSGRSDPERIFLRDEAYFAGIRAEYRRGRRLAGLDAGGKVAELDDGSAVKFDKLLLATGARPTIPDVPGIEQVSYHVLRTLDDALRLRSGLSTGARHAVVLGAGLIGLHAAENMRRAGARVTVIELQPQVLPGYFDGTAAAMIARAFDSAGVEIRANAVTVPNPGIGRAALDDGECLAGTCCSSAPASHRWIPEGLANRRDRHRRCRMRTSAPAPAAGDAAQASGLRPDAGLNGICSTCRQGRIVGMAMRRSAIADYWRRAAQHLRLFGRHAVSVGSNAAPNQRSGPQRRRRRLISRSSRRSRLHGIFAINTLIDAGVMWGSCRRTDLASVRDCSWRNRARRRGS